VKTVFEIGGFVVAGAAEPAVQPDEAQRSALKELQDASLIVTVELFHSLQIGHSILD
jgi:hypothetical protein